MKSKYLNVWKNEKTGEMVLGAVAWSTRAEADNTIWVGPYKKAYMIVVRMKK